MPYGPSGAKFIALGTDHVVAGGMRLTKSDKWKIVKGTHFPTSSLRNDVSFFGSVQASEQEQKPGPSVPPLTHADYSAAVLEDFDWTTLAVGRQSLQSSPREFQDLFVLRHTTLVFNNKDQTSSSSCMECLARPGVFLLQDDVFSWISGAGIRRGSAPEYSAGSTHRLRQNACGSYAVGTHAAIESSQAGGDGGGSDPFGIPARMCGGAANSHARMLPVQRVKDAEGSLPPQGQPLRRPCLNSW
eukprot:2212838-Pyramimonas_sp.AAC.1